MHVKYTGPGRGRDIRLPDGNEVNAPKNQAVEVPDAVGKSLCQQKYWEEAKQNTKRAPAESAGNEQERS